MYLYFCCKSDPHFFSVYAIFQDRKFNATLANKFVKFWTSWPWLQNCNILKIPQISCTTCDWENHDGVHYTFQPGISSRTRLYVRPATTQIIRGGWSDSMLSVWRRYGSLTTNRVSCEDSDQPAKMCRLIGVFARWTCPAHIDCKRKEMHTFNIVRFYNLKPFHPLNFCNGLFYLWVKT